MSSNTLLKQNCIRMKSRGGNVYEILLSVTRCFFLIDGFEDF